MFSHPICQYSDRTQWVGWRWEKGHNPGVFRIWSQEQIRTCADKVISFRWIPSHILFRESDPKYWHHVKWVTSLVSLLLLWRDTISKAAFTKRRAFNWVLAYSFRCLVHYHHGTTGAVVESYTLNFRQRGRKTKTRFWYLNAHPQWHTSSNKTIS